MLTQVWAAAQSRIALPEDERDLFPVFVDEVKHYASESSNFDEILSESREYGLAVWMISQYLDQLDPAMQQAAINNCRTKVIFQPEIADDGTRIANMLVGLDKDDLQRLGSYRAAMQTPDGTEAVTFDTLPPWDPQRDTEEIQQLKQRSAVAAEGEVTEDKLFDLGPAGNAGDQLHSMLLQESKEYLESRPAVSQVNLLHQDPGEDRPDAHVIKDNGDVAHLEAEVSTLTKPAKVLTNLWRAAFEDNKCIFVVEESGVDRLLNIIEDPVNRRGSEYEDEEGSYSYYTDEDGDEFTGINDIADAEYRVLVRGESGNIRDYGTETDSECPELDEETSKDELASFCLFREDGWCTALDTECVITREKPS